MIEKLKERGITLVALVVTIIIILILAGVTISQITGDNGLISRTKQAKVEYEKESIKEEIRLALLDKQLEKNGELSEGEIRDVLDVYGEVTGNGKDMKLTTDGTSYEITYEEIMQDNETTSSGGTSNSGGEEITREELVALNEKINKLESELHEKQFLNAKTINVWPETFPKVSDLKTSAEVKNWLAPETRMVQYFISRICPK